MGIWFQRFSVGGIAVVLLVSGGCASPGKKTAIGAGGGAVGGAAIGAAIGGGKGAAIGAIAGAAVGAAVGNYLDKQAQELEKVAETHRTANGIVVRLQNELLFATNSTKLNDQAITQLNQLGQIISKYPQDRIRIQGFTDDVGNDTYNQQLSERRASAVKSVLSDSGVPENRMMAKGLGESQPIASNADKSGRARNRRVELYIDVPKEEQAAVENQQKSATG